MAENRVETVKFSIKLYRMNFEDEFCVLRFGNFMSHIMHCALSSLLQSVQYSIHNPRDLNNIYADTSELHTTLLATNFVAEHTAICNCSN